MRSLLAALACLLLAALAFARPQESEAARRSPVGIPQTLRDVVLPGPELEVAPSDFATPVSVRLAAVRPHGTDFRYDIVYYGLDPGEYDLRDFLRRKTGAPADDLPPLLVTVESVLPPGQVQPSRPTRADLPAVGGYRTWIWVLGIGWVLGLAALLRAGRRRDEETGGPERGPRTVAERLRPLVEAAVAGRLSREEHARLELTLIAFWRKKRGLDGVGAAEALATLREDGEAGPLLRQLEDWLHRPAAGGEGEGVDLAALLAPYQNLPADALELSGAAGPSGGGGA
ncbi:MAG: hypothetical protein AAF682_21155 [Planctomycetota bacterium]